MVANRTNMDLFWHWVNERNSILERRQAGLPRDQWTDDTILDTYRFCNVYRELDRTTVWIKEHIRDKYLGNPNYMAILALSRVINLPESLEALLESSVSDSGVDWDMVRDVYLSRRAAGQRLRSAAYRISFCGGGPYKSSIEAYIQNVYAPLSRDNDVILSQVKEHEFDIKSSMNILKGYRWIGGGFLNNQVLIDLAHTSAGSEWYRQNGTCIGPGSKRGLDILFGSSKGWYDSMESIRCAAMERIENPPVGYEQISLHDIQNCLCEFAKYHGYVNGNKMRRRYYR